MSTKFSEVSWVTEYGFNLSQPNAEQQGISGLRARYRAYFVLLQADTEVQTSSRLRTFRVLRACRPVVGRRASGCAAFRESIPRPDIDQMIVRTCGSVSDRSCRRFRRNRPQAFGLVLLAQTRSFLDQSAFHPASPSR